MKKLHFLLFVGFFAILAGCAKDNLQSDITKQPAIQSLSGLIDSGIDIKTWQSQNIGHHSVNPNPAITTRSTDFTTDPLDCTDLPVEDFEEGPDQISCFPSPLNELSNDWAFTPGEILPGVTISTTLDYFTCELVALPAGSPFGNPSKMIAANVNYDNLLINFTAEGVRNVSMKVFDFLGGGGVIVEVFGISGSIGSTVVASSSTGSQVSISTTEDIVQITLSSLGYGHEGVDDLAFGTCVTYIIIDGCDSGVEDYEFEDGSTMMDLILECAENAGNHGEFVSCVAHLTNTWKKAGLITGAQKDTIMNCAGGADLP